MMSDDMLSQDEIDALLKGTNDDQNTAVEQPPVDDFLSGLEQDALGEIGNISFGSAATALSTLLNQKVEITTPTTSAVKRSLLEQEFPQPHVAVRVTYTKGFAGMNVLVIRSQDAAVIADLMLGGDGTNPESELNEIHLSAVQEAMNQMMGSAATSMSTIFNKRVDISPPSIDVLDVKHGEGTEQIPEEDILIKVSFQLKVGNLIDSRIMQLLPIEFSKDLVDQLLNPQEEVLVPPKEEIRVSQEENSFHQESGYQEPVHSTPKHMGGLSTRDAEEAQTAEFSEFVPSQIAPNEQRNLDMLLDIPLKVTVELGRTKRTIKDILELSAGSIVELDKLAGEPVDILVNDKLIAKGEVVVIDENFGVRVTDILSQRDRLNKIQ
ncbi:flagellar motor switch phosphatase FliY [Bacillaceae bacterium S4-13-58]